jgi:hypothetical protein
MTRMIAWMAVASYSCPMNATRPVPALPAVPQPTPSCAAIVNMPMPAARRSLIAASVAPDILGLVACSFNLGSGQNWRTVARRHVECRPDGLLGPL